MPTPLPRNPELEAAAFASLDDHDAWRVYADWLQAQGDARGELILLSLHERDAFLSERREFDTRRKDSERAMTTPYLIVALWGGQDGSLLWWLFLTALFSGICVKWLGRR